MLHRRYYASAESLQQPTPAPSSSAREILAAIA